MSQIDGKETISSEDTVEHNEGDSLKVVPVAESIRYRKRAQSAEKEAKDLAEQLTQARSEVARLAEQLSDIQLEQKLMRRLTVAGAVDLETAVLIAKARVGDEVAADLDGVIGRLKKEKQYLFDGSDSRAVTAKKTAGAKDQMRSGQAILEKTAKKAAVTGSRADLQEYLKLRRNFV